MSEPDYRLVPARSPRMRGVLDNDGQVMGIVERRPGGWFVNQVSPRAKHPQGQFDTEDDAAQAVRDVVIASRRADAEPEGLTDVQARVLAYERAWYAHPPHFRPELAGLTPAEHLAVLRELMANPAAWAQSDALLVHIRRRLLRMELQHRAPTRPTLVLLRRGTA